MISLAQGSTVKWNTGTNEITSIAATAFTNNSFIMSFCDDTANKMFFKVWNTNGTNTTGEVSVDDTAGACGYVSTDVCALNSTHAIVIWYDSVDSDASAALVNSTGSIVISQFDLDTDVGASMAVSCAALNNTYWVGCWDDNTDRDATCNVYNMNTASGADIDIDTEVVGEASSYPYAIAVGALNSTHWVAGYYDRNQSDASYTGYNFRTNFITAADEDTDVGNVGYSISITTHNSTHWSIGYYDSTDADATYSTYKLGARVKGPVDIDAAVGASDSAIRVAAQNSTQLVITFLDNDSYDLAYGINSTFMAGSIFARTNIENYAATNKYARYQDIASYKPSTNIGFCNQSFVVVYVNSSTQADFRTYEADGSEWSGICDFSPPTFNMLVGAGNPNEERLITSRWLYRNGTWQSEDWINITVNVTDPNGVDSVWVNWKNASGWYNYTMGGGTGGVYSVNITNQPAWFGYTFNISANDTLGNTGQIYYWIFNDYGNPTYWGDMSLWKKTIGLNNTPEDFTNKQFYSWGYIPYNFPYQANSRKLPHEQQTDTGTFDSGISNYTRPTEKKQLNCTVFLGLYMDQTVNVSSVTITNIYLHLWWNTTTNSIWIEYEKENDTGLTADYDERYFTNTSFAKAQANVTGFGKGGYNLEAGLWDITDQVFIDNTINLLAIKFNSTADIPAMASGGNFSSFFILNLPDNATLQLQDTDSDDMNDFRELYEFWSDPRQVDTDLDGTNDNIDCEPVNPLNSSVCDWSECDSSHCSLCLSEGDCETATCYWWADETCHDTEESANCWTNIGKLLFVPSGCLAGPFTWEEII